MSKSQDLRTIRTKRGFTLEDLSSMTGIRVASLSNIETGRHTASDSTRQKVESVLGSSIDWTVTFTGGDRAYLAALMRNQCQVDQHGSIKRFEFLRKLLGLILQDIEKQLHEDNEK